jgi:hypothetical protein
MSSWFCKFIHSGIRLLRLKRDDEVARCVEFRSRDLICVLVAAAFLDCGRYELISQCSVVSTANRWVEDVNGCD